ncbi:unnamed protein product [Phaedon cochleariae]|uniref:DUF4806 domain-containing protein n=1 Tax=Phaedon cochleariae TaxID=80249 RepID=A0A9N9SJI0_PHACE|nr:unnamed protein product [Phaedon cochleariae]
MSCNQYPEDTGSAKKMDINRTSSEESITPPPFSSEKPKKKNLATEGKTYNTEETGSEREKEKNNEPEESIMLQSFHKEMISPMVSEKVNKIVPEVQDHEIQDIENMPIVIADGNMVDLHSSIERLTRICLDMQKNIKSLHKIMKTLHTKNGQLEADNYLKNLEEKLPLKSLDELEPFDTHLSDVENKRSFISYMKSVGGRDLKDNMNRCLGLIYTNNLSRSCSLQGKRGNFKLGETYTMKLFIDIMVSQHKTSISEVQAYISEWFRLAKQRFLRKK